MKACADDDDIRYAYRLLLGREPDQAGFEMFSQLVRDNEILPADLARLFLGSAEFRSRYSTELQEVVLDGFSVFHRADDDDVGRPLAQTMTWEPHVTAALGERLSQGKRFLDVGANIGYFMAFAAHRVGAAGRVVAVEPMDKNLQLLYVSVVKNGFDHVRVEPFAASDSQSVVGIDTRPGSSNGQMRSGSDAHGQTTYVQTRRLDELLANESGFDVVKFDIEGHELHAWRGFERSLLRDRPVVLTEFHPQCLRNNAQTDPAAFADALLRYGTTTVLDASGRRSVCKDVDALMRHWARTDEALGTDGGAHLDLLVEPAI